MAISEIIKAGGSKDLDSIAEEILKENPDAKTALSALLKVAFKDELSVKSYNEIHDTGSYKKNKDFYYDDRGISGYRQLVIKKNADMLIAKEQHASLLPKVATIIWIHAN